MIKEPGLTKGSFRVPSGITMNSTMKKLPLAAYVLALAFTLYAASAQAQGISAVNGGRSTIALNLSFVTTLADAGLGLTGADASQRAAGFITFPITSGAINVGTAAGQILHSGGIVLNSPTTTVTLDCLIVDTLGANAFVTALVEVNGTFIGRVKLFDFVLPRPGILPNVSSHGIFNISGAQLTLDDEAANALNIAFGSKAFVPGTEVGDWQSMVLVPLPLQGIVISPVGPVKIF